MIKSKGTPGAFKFPEEFFYCTRITPEQLEVMRDSQVMGKGVYYTCTHHSQDMWEHILAQPVICAQLWYSVIMSATKRPLATDWDLHSQASNATYDPRNRISIKGHRVETLLNPRCMSKWRRVKISWLISHGGTSKVNKSTIFWFPD